MDILEVPRKKSCIGCKSYKVPATHLPCVACKRLKEHREDYFESEN